ncbi:hypothetical protein DFP72DRAFT_1069629 [Ephemerocybe angulata]|uniref:Uncharacterized protein n=1 Tax=Ephemerocybe angulata TaxID=980116 RepID=A0A8H6HU37_9AGAR|nr:hypothetical protein DFP72DRAFT_1069629 [Tulosesus angulatus]
MSPNTILSSCHRSVRRSAPASRIAALFGLCIIEYPQKTRSCVLRVSGFLQKEKGRHSCGGDDEDGHDETEEVSTVSTPNCLVLALHRNRNRKHAGVAQVNEYWPLSKPASLTPDDMTALLEGPASETPLITLAIPPTPPHNLLNSKSGSIFFICPSSRRSRLRTETLTIVLLNQGNPVVGGRVGRRTPHAGVSSVLAAPTFANISVTLTLSARQGDRPQTLLALARLAQVVNMFVASDGGARRESGSYTGNTMVAIVERASMVVTPTLRHIVRAGET